MKPCDKCKDKVENLKKEVFRLQEYMSKFREIEDKFNIKKGTYVFVEYKSEIGVVRTASGMFIRETKQHISVRVKDAKGDYNYIIKKKLINGMKVYRNKQ